MKQVNQREQGNVKVVVYENTITHNPNPFYTVESFVAGVKQPYNNAGWSKDLAVQDMDNIFNLLTK